jgi:hypothetical protein
MFVGSSRYNHLDLPIYDPETDIKFGPLTRALVETVTDPSFVRAVRIRTPRRLGKLTEALKRTDEELDLLAEHCGAIVIKHEWGLYPMPHRDDNDRIERYRPDARNMRHLGIPRGHIVAAEIPVLPHFEKLPPEESVRTQKSVDEYLRLTKGPVLRDMAAHQFGAITPPVDAVTTSDTKVLIDVEPLWMNPNATLLELLCELF